MMPSVWSGYFSDLTPETMVDTFHAKRWLFSELSHEHAFVLLQRGDPVKTGRRFREYADDKGMSFPQGHLWLTCDIAGHKRLETVDRLKAWLDLFSAIGTERAVLHPGTSTRYLQGDDPEAIEADCADSLRLLCAYLAGSKTIICLENLYNHARTCADLLRLIDLVGSENLAICLDTGHLNMSGGSQREFISQAGIKLRALHIADNEGETDQHIMPYGKGNIDWQDTVAALRENSYHGLFNFEIPGESAAPLELRLKKLDYLRNMSDFLLGGDE